MIDKKIKPSQYAALGRVQHQLSVIQRGIRTQQEINDANARSVRSSVMAHRNKRTRGGVSLPVVQFGRDE